MTTANETAEMQDNDKPQPQPQQTSDVPTTWDEIFKHPRFRELARQAKDAQAALDAVKAQQAEAEQKRLEDEKRFQELWQKEQERAKSLEDQIAQRDAALLETQRNGALRDAIAAHKPAVRAEAVGDLLRLIDTGALDASGDMTAQAVALVGEALKTRPWLLQSGASYPGSPTTPAPAGPASDAKARDEFERALRSQIIR